MYKKILPLLVLVLLFVSGLAQQPSDKTDTVKTDTAMPVLKTSDGKIVTVGQPISMKPLSTTDKIKLFFEAVYAKYPVWCWIWAVIIVLAIGRFLSRIFSK